MKANIVEIKRFAVHDGDGIRTTVFFKGCPLKCLWCHNPETISPKQQLAFYAHKCIGCGKCAAVCSCHTLKSNHHIIDRDNCSLCGKCVDVCPQTSLGIKNTLPERIPTDANIDTAKKILSSFGLICK
ncbi:MAG: 4Fe-4S binding protein [Eubacteriales bacterium]|nr:4Fe-4S binding protein [Eubacteriales bacterium]